MIVMFDLRGWERMVQTEISFNEILSEFPPVDLRISHMVRIVIPGRTAKFCSKRNVEQQTHLLFETFYKHADFFAQSGRRSGLSVCPGEHRNSCPFDAEFF